MTWRRHFLCFCCTWSPTVKVVCVSIFSTMCVLFSCVYWCSLHSCHPDRRDSPFFHCGNTLAHRWLSPPLWQVGRVGDNWGVEGWGWGGWVCCRWHRGHRQSRTYTHTLRWKKKIRKKGEYNVNIHAGRGLRGGCVRGWKVWVAGWGLQAGVCAATCNFWHWCGIAHKALAPLPTLGHTASHGGACQRGLAAQKRLFWTLTTP